MPALDKSLEEEQLARVMIYGRPMTRKTWWVLKIAEAGFNIIYADFDNNLQVARNIDAEARKRIYRLDLRMPVNSIANNGAFSLMKAAQGDTILFDEKARQYVPTAKVEADTTYTRLDFAKLGPDTVLVVDSWTAMQTCLSQAQRKIIDVTDVAKPEWDDYAKLRMADDVFLSNLAKLNCHVVVVGHVETYAKKRPDADPRSKTPHNDIEAVREQPASATRAHGESLAKSFTDMLFFTQPKAGQDPVIKTNGCEDFDAGSRSKPPGVYQWANLQFTDLLSEGAKSIGKNAQPLVGIGSVTGAEVIANRAAAKAGGATITPGKTPTSRTILSSGK